MSLPVRSLAALAFALVVAAPHVARAAPVTTESAAPAGINGPPSLLSLGGDILVGTTILGGARCWVDGGVELSLTATDAVAGVASLTWAATGAQVGGATVPGASDVFVIRSAGLTVVTWSATDGAGGVEATRWSAVIVAPAVGLACATAASAGPIPELPDHGAATLSGRTFYYGARPLRTPAFRVPLAY